MASFNMDKLTLEYFTNKSSYHKYLAKKDPKTYQDNNSFKESLREHHEDILHIVSQYMKKPSDITNKKTFDSFQHFMLDMIDLCEKQKANTDNNEDDSYKKKDDEEEMFSQCEDLGIAPKTPIEFWKMEKVFKTKPPNDTII